MTVALASRLDSAIFGEDVPDAGRRSQAWAEQNLAKAARPVRWNVIDELPRSSVGKIRRFKLKTS